ncbi:MAG: creatininase family protein [Rhodospirillales bacterium]|nr:creatininase family protein [Rhodospirillales bacterium]MDE0380202.1 creatininase family protein [Rhodospirillales bacterium]
MRIRDMNWMQVEAYLERDDRAVVPLGSTEQHAQLSLMVDCILSERVAVDAAEPLGVPVFPPVNYGITPYFKSYPGTISMRPETLIAVFRDVFDSLKRAGFRRIMVVNGHGGNAPVASLAQDWMSENAGVTVRFHNWYNAPETWKKVQEIDPAASHASWMENFPWTRLASAAAPAGAKDMVDIPRMMLMNPAEIRAYIGDGNMGGVYQKPDEEMMALWETAVEETRALLDGPWS